jgi:hypothetical protein
VKRSLKAGFAAYIADTSGIIPVAKRLFALVLNLLHFSKTVPQIACEHKANYNTISLIAGFCETIYNKAWIHTARDRILQ